jgi:release factor glutamine methyltransferase
MRPDTVTSAWQEGRRRLERANVSSAALDARLLLQHAAGLAPEDVIAEPVRPLGPPALAAYRSLIDRRSRHEPVSRIIGTREFYGRLFAITPAVLDPRPDTETLVEAALTNLPPSEPKQVLDLGTGSGAIIVTLLAERPLSRGVATDRSAPAIAVARGNAVRHDVASRLTLIEASWWQNVAGEFDVIVSNPPYIPHAAIADLPEEVRNFDPPDALDGGLDGCEAYRRIAADARQHLAAEGRLLVEIGHGQTAVVRGIFEDMGLAATGQWADLGGRTRCLGFGRRPPE